MRRRHADVGDDDIGIRPLDGRAEAVEVVCHLDQLDTPDPAEDARDPLANEVAVLADDYADRHRPDPVSRLARSGASGTQSRTVTPARGSEAISSSPPIAPIRSRIVISPIPS